RRPEQPGETDAGQEDARELDAGDEAVDLDVAEAGQQVEERPEGGPPEEEEQAEREGAEERPCAQVRPCPRRADERAEEDERGDDRSAAAVEEPAGEEPAEHLARAERVGEIRAVVV